MKSISTVCLVWFAASITACDKPNNPSPTDASSIPEEITIETDEGKVEGYTTEVAEYPQKIDAISAAESRQFKEWASEAQTFLTAYGTPQAENELKQYDEAFKAWQVSPVKKHSDQDVINILGAYLGQRMVEDLDMAWVFVTDQYGQDYAVRHKTYEMMSFPF